MVLLRRLLRCTAELGEFEGRVLAVRPQRKPKMKKKPWEFHVYFDSDGEKVWVAEQHIWTKLPGGGSGGGQKEKKKQKSK